jgi:hypothetical protein
MISGELTKKFATGFSLGRLLSCKQSRSPHGIDQLLLTYIGYDVTPRVGGRPWPYVGPARLRNAAEKSVMELL